MDNCQGSGHPKISTIQDDERLVEQIQEHPFETANEAVRNTGFPGCLRTAQRRIREVGLRSCVAVNKTFLTPAWKEERIGFALQYLGRQHFRNNVIYTDEKMFQSWYNGKVKVYRPPGTRFQNKYINKVRTNPRFSINVWGWLSARGMGVLWHIENRLNSDVYINILENVMLPSVTVLYPDRNFALLQDNCPVHNSRRTRQWLNRNNISVLDFPRYSGDLNIIENVWGLMVRNIAKQNIHIQNQEQLSELVQAASENIPEEFLINLVHSMPQRIAAVLNARGENIKY
ncbi:transposable element-related [Holotrichia oblita]|uniref:Transposable element-related n=1 Tax=Holotrichia oblita TaxID=644536 RepID=A0ACB9TZ40_HOLOL|nr:transposable element-related [Holotrichia oblita]